MTKIESYKCDSCKLTRAGFPHYIVERTYHSFGTYGEMDVCSSCAVVIDSAMKSCAEAAGATNEQLEAWEAEDAAGLDP